jgi:hypothetical protein
MMLESPWKVNSIFKVEVIYKYIYVLCKIDIHVQHLPMLLL